MPVNRKFRRMGCFRGMRQCVLRGFPESQYKWLGRGRYGRMRLGSNKKCFGVGWRSVC